MSMLTARRRHIHNRMHAYARVVCAYAHADHDADRTVSMISVTRVQIGKRGIRNYGDARGGGASERGQGALYITSPLY